MNVFITGDTHGEFSHIVWYAKKNKTTVDDIMIVLGDAGLNYFLDIRDIRKKTDVSKIPLTFFCIHGNHEERPYNIEGYKTKEFHEGIVYYEEEYPNILFAKDGEIYDFNGYKCLVAGGAYSVDKSYRLKNSWHWFESEQPTQEIKETVNNAIANNRVDVILSHTCPFSKEPVESFLPMIDQSTVDVSTEKWLDDIYNKYGDKIIRWYCGHFHIEKNDRNVRFMFNNISLFNPKE